MARTVMDGKSYHYDWDRREWVRDHRPNLRLRLRKLFSL